MTDPAEITRGVLMRLQASVEETFRAIKSEYRKEPYEGQTDAIATLCNRLAQLEGGLITLQQYSENIHTVTKSARLNVAIQAARLVQTESAANAAREELPSVSIGGEEELSKRSSQYRKSKKRSKVKPPENEGIEDEQEDEEGA